MDWPVVILCVGAALAAGYALGRRARPDGNIFGGTVAGPQDFTPEERDEAKRYIVHLRSCAAIRQAQAKQLKASGPDDSESAKTVSRFDGCPMGRPMG